MKKTLFAFAAAGFWLVSAAGAAPQSVPDASGPASAPRKIVGSIAPAAGAQKDSADAVAIPANAVKVDEQHYRAKDKNGLDWIYTKTPFGINKSRADQAESATPARAEKGVRASVTGDQAFFERRTPFGVNAWTKKLSELSPEEKALVASIQDAAPAAANKAESNQRAK
jgi:hypothetical protein